MIYQYLSDIIKKVPSVQTGNIRYRISENLEKKRAKIFVIDDDPTGIQTVHGCTLLTKWSVTLVKKALQGNSHLLYILSNSRSRSPEIARKLNLEIVESLIRANESCHYKLIIISRSDSTLRGHFPLETDAILEKLHEHNIEVELPVFFVPALLEAGRITAGNIQYMVEGDNLLPVARSEFARDTLFGYKNSNLTDYIIEKSAGTLSRKKIGSISLEELRKLESPELQEKITSLSGRRFLIINAVEYPDLHRFSFALTEMMGPADRAIIMRTSSSLPKALSGIPDKDLLTGQELGTGGSKGIFVIGSHVPRTTRQLNELLENSEVEGIEIDVMQILQDEETCFKQTMNALVHAFNRDKTPALYTTRKELRSENMDAAVHSGRKISGFLASVIKQLPISPSYIVSKGGITSHDILVDGLNVTSSTVSGQILPGVPVLKIRYEEKGRKIPFIIFPGNVGGTGSLSELFKKLV
ncbi:MAG: hypothetical protein JXR52_05620 [Bacteroidales bacterium]|nr:hypothetical protein [Bacteroidales bacterium]MBN2698285.1 hypothetical protein [Bacteroidales bacterium]